MRVNVVSYLFYEKDPGGRGMTVAALMADGFRRGHDLRFSHMRPNPVISAHSNPDIWLLDNVWNLPWYWKKRHRRILSHIPWTAAARYNRLVASAVKSANFVHLDNAYVDVCDLPYLPCNGLVVGTECPFKEGLTPTQRQCFRVTTEPLYRRSLLNFFVSPLHAKVIEQLLGLPPNRSHILRPAMNSALFTNRQSPVRDIPLLFVGPFNEAKGSAEISRRWPNGEVRVIGPRTPDASRYPGYAGALPYSEVLDTMARAQTFVFHPRWPEPFGRVVAEAALSGCALDTNDHVGALSFRADLGDPALYENSDDDFWLTLESLIN